MKSFTTEDFLLATEAVRKLYHERAEKSPIFDYHCHLSPQEICENRQFADIGEALPGCGLYDRALGAAQLGGLLKLPKRTGNKPLQLRLWGAGFVKFYKQEALTWTMY